MKTQNSVEAIKKAKHEKEKLMSVARDLPRLEFEPLKTWPAKSHPRQSEIDFLMRGLPSYEP